MKGQGTHNRVVHTTYISTDVGRCCEHCDFWIGLDEFKDISESINHYLQKHGYSLLHIGTQSHDVDGELHHATVAVLGTDKVLPPRKKSKASKELDKLRERVKRKRDYVNE